MSEPRSRRIPVHVTLAELGDGRAFVARWLKGPGEPVAKDEPLLEISTDKANVELASPASGVLRLIAKGPDAPLAAGDLLGELEAVDAVDTAVAREADAHGHLEPAPPPRRFPSSSGSFPAQGLSPAIRRMLRDHGLRAEDVTGTGEDGRLTRQDVLDHLARSAPARSRMVPHPTMRRQAAANMVASFAASGPQVTVVFEADLGAVLAHRAAAHAPHTLTAYIVAAAARALTAVPEVNSRWHDDGLEVYDDANIGLVTALGAAGLVVPVIKRAQTLSLAEIGRAVDDLKRRAQARTLLATEIRGGTFTISNHGTSGSLIATPILHERQSAILGIGALRRVVAAVARDGAEAIEIRSRAFVTLTIDHRALDAHHTNAFLTTFCQTLESAG